MVNLTEKQKKFVDAIVETGGVNRTECARMAGYGGTEANLRNHAHDLIRDPKILEAIIEDTRLNAGQVLPGIMRNLINTAMNPQDRSSARVGLQLLAMFGLSPVSKTESKKTVEHTTNLGALEELKLLAAQLRGLPAPKIVDVTPEEEEWSAYG